MMSPGNTTIANVKSSDSTSSNNSSSHPQRTAAATANSPPALPSSSPLPQTTKEQDHQRRLEEASAVCAKGRQYWTQHTTDPDAAHLALKEFEHALRLLETLLGTYHTLTAKTYYWLGFIRKHDPTTYPEALQAFVQTARIRLVLLGPSHESTQEAISAIRWVLVHQSQPNIKEYLAKLYESIRLETQGDARLRHRDYTLALQYYQQAMETFVDPRHATIMGKRAFCAFKLQDHADALRWYRQALLVFTTQTVHGLQHPDVPTTLERMEQVLLAQSVLDKESIAKYLSPNVLLTSVQEQWQGQTQLSKGNIRKAQDHFKACLELEGAVLGAHHSLIIQVLQPWLDITTALLQPDMHLESTIQNLQQETMQLRQQQQQQQAVEVAAPDTADNKALQQHNAALETQLLAMQKERQEWQTKWEHAQLDLMELQTRLEDQDGQQSNQQQEVMEQEKAKWQEEQERLVQDHQRQLQEQDAHIQSLNVKLQQVQQEAATAQQQHDPTLMARLTSELEQAQQATQAFEQRLVSAEQAAASLNEVRRTTQAKLDASMQQQNLLQQELQDCHETIQELHLQLAAKKQAHQEWNDSALSSSFPSNMMTPSQSPARPKGVPSSTAAAASPSNFSTISTWTTNMDPPGNTADTNNEDSHFQKARRLEAELDDQFKDLIIVGHNSDDDKAVVNVEKIKSQNERAVKTIKALSKELLGLEEKYRKLATKYEKLKGMWTKLEGKHRALKEENAQMVQQQQASGSGTSTTTGGGAFGTSSSSVTRSTGSAPAESTVAPPQQLPPPTAEMTKSVRLSQSTYQSTVAQYVLRRPFLTPDEYSEEEHRYFEDTPVCARAEAYASLAHVQNPASIEVVAVIGFDHSRLYLSSNNVVAHRKMDGSWTDLGYLDDSRGEPFGWVSFVDSSNSSSKKQLYYSLDEIVEEAQIYRQHYCQAVALGDHGGRLFLPKLLMWLARRVESPLLESWAYRYSSRASSFGGKQTSRRIWDLKLKLAVLVLLLAIWIARYLMT